MTLFLYGHETLLRYIDKESRFKRAALEVPKLFPKWFQNDELAYFN